MNEKLLLEFDLNDKLSPKLTKINNQLQNTDKTTNKLTDTNKGLDKSFSNTIKTVATLAITYKTLDVAYNGIIKNGLDYNRQIEQQTAGISALVSATSANVDSLGNQLTAQQKFNLAGQESIEIMDELQRINSKLPTTLTETASIYKSLLPSFKEAGASQKELIDLTEKFAIVSNVAGIEMNSLVATVDSVASGTLIASSDLGKFMSAMGLTNETLKKTDDVTKLVLETFKDFNTLDTYATAVSNLEDSWDSLTGKLTKDIFAGQKESIKELTKIVESFTSNKDDMEALQRTIVSFANTSIDAVEGVVNSFLQIRQGYLILEQYGTMAFSGIELFANDVQIKVLKFIRDIAFEYSEILGKIGVNVNFTEMTRSIAELEQSNARLVQSTNKRLELSDQEIIDLERLKLKTTEIADVVKNSLNPATLQTTENINETGKAIDSANNKMGKLIKSIAKPETVEINIGGSISNAIIDGINGSNLEEIIGSLSSSMGSSMISSGVGALALTGAINPYAAIGGGIALNAVGGLFGGGSDRETATEKAQARATSELNKFIEALKGTIDVMNTFGNIGSSTVYEFDRMQTEYINNLKQYLSNSIASQNQWFTDMGKISALNLEFFNKAIPGLETEDVYSGEFNGTSQFAKVFTDESQKIIEDFLIGIAPEKGIKAGYASSKFSADEYTKIQELDPLINAFVTDKLPSFLDFSSMSIESLNEIVKDFDKDAFDKTNNALNELSLSVKEAGGEVTQEDIDLFRKLYDTNFILGQDYQEAIQITEDFNDTLADTIKQMTFVSNDYELAFASIGATTEQITELRKQQIQDEIDFLISKTPELADAKDDFLSFYDGISPENTDLIESAEEIGDLLVEQAQLNYEAADAIEESNEAQKTLTNHYESQANEIIKLADAYSNISDEILSFIADLNYIPQSLSEIMDSIGTASSVEDIDNIFNSIQKNYRESEDALNDFYDLEIDNINDRIELIEKENSVLLSLMDFVDDIRLEQLKNTYSTDAIKGQYTSSLSSLQTALLTNDPNAGSIAADTEKYAKAYLESFEDTASNMEDFKFEQGKLLASMEDLAGGGRPASLETLQKELVNAEENNILALDELKSDVTNALSVLNDSSLDLRNGLNSDINNLTNTAIDFLGEGSAIVNWLSTLDASVNNLSFGESETKTAVAVAQTSALQSNPTPLSTSSNYNTLNTAYNELFGRDVDLEGLAYWSDRLDSGLSTSNLTTALLGGATAYTGEGYIDPETQLKLIANNVVPFADGGIVTKPTLGLIGEAGYNEAVVPFKDPSDPLNMKAVSNKVDKTNEKLDILERILTTLVTNNINTYKLLQRIEQNGLIALEETA